ncbi:MAG: hypothetical protein Q4G48_10100 [Bacteroidia bacterium]|nr:hypothetical protein [Bacteroidia bacterium]
MKTKLIMILLLGLTISCNQSTKTQNSETNVSATEEAKIDTVTNQPKDTLAIVDPDFTFDPFAFGENPLQKLISIDNAGINLQPHKNRHVEDQMDTIYQLKFGLDRFEIYKTASKNWLTEAHVLTDNFHTRHGVKIGMTKTEVKNRLNITSAESLPDYVRFEHSEVPEFMDLNFKNNKLQAIIFKGYLD